MQQDWFWVRHGPTHAKTMIGWTDLPADLSNHRQIARVRSHLPHDASLVTSDLRRATETAHAIFPEKQSEVRTPDLREIHFGAWEGRSHKDVEEEDRDRIFAFWDQPGDIAPPGGESWNGFRARVDGFVDNWHAAGSVVAVAHLGVIVSQIQRALDLPAREAFAHKIDNLSVTHLTLNSDRTWHVRAINHIP